jgi:hypothetical protein
VATALAVLSLIGVSYPGPVLARLCQRAENEFVGANCGIMDQFISANGKENHALLLDCRDLSFKLAPIPANVALVIANTMVKHSIAGGDYKTRRAEVRGRLRRHCQPPARGHLPARCTLEDLEKWGHEMDAQVAICAPATSSAKTCAPWPPPRRCSGRHEGTGPPDGRGAPQLQPGLSRQLPGGRRHGGSGAGPARPDRRAAHRRRLWRLHHQPGGAERWRTAKPNRHRAARFTSATRWLAVSLQRQNFHIKTEPGIDSPDRHICHAIFRRRSPK